MSTSLAEMAARLEQKVPQRNGAPASYHATVREAVAHFGQGAPLIRQVDLDIVAGVAGYALPADFAKVIGLSIGAVVPGAVIVSANGLIPTSPTRPIRPSFTIRDGQIMFDPVPTFGAVWTLRYAAKFVESAGVFPALDDNGARIALLYAAYLALSEQAHTLATEAWSYTIGAETIDRSKLAQSVRAEADKALQAYRDARKGMHSLGTMGLETRLL